MKTIIALLILTGLIFNIHSQWTVQQFYPDYYEGTFRLGAVTPLGFAIGESGIIRRTTDYGLSWVNIYSGTSANLNGIVFGVFADTTEGYAAGNSGVILKTTNSGLNWVVQNTGIMNGLFDIEIGRGDTAIAVGTLGTVVRTTNGGINWSVQTLGGGTTHLWGIYSYSFQSFYICDGLGRVYISNNAGATWAQYSTGIATALYDIDYLNLNYFSVGYNGQIVRSTNSGANWTILTSGTSEVLNDVEVPLVNNVLVAVSDGSILRSTNYGTNFSVIAPAAGVSLNDLEIAPNDIVMGFGSDGFLKRSTDNGATWSNTAYGSNEAITGVHFTAPLTGFACGGGGLVYRTTNGGANWSNALYLGTFNLTSIDFATPSTGYITGEIFPNLENGTECRVYRTTNNGLTWAVLSTFSNTRELYSIEFADASTGWILAANAVTENGAATELFKTTNAGSSWTNVINFNITINDIHFINTSTGWAAAVGGNLARTTNGGLNWQQVGTPTSSDYSSIMFVSQTQGYACGDGGVIITTTNSGQNWTQQVSGTNYPLNSIYFGSAINGICVGENGARLRTTNGGQTWNNNGEESMIQLFNCYMPTSINAYMCGDLGYIANFGGIVTGTEPVSNIIPNEYMLEQNYPNPFNPVTNIKFSIPKGTQISLKVYDITGKEVAALFNGYMQPGIYSYTFNSMGLPSGVYFYRLDTEKFTETKKMILIK